MKKNFGENFENFLKIQPLNPKKADVINGFALIGATLVITIKLATTIGFSKITEVCERTKCNTMFSSWLEPKEHFDLTYRSAPLIIVFRLLIDALISLPLQQAMAQVEQSYLLFSTFSSASICVKT